jgi:hypothetical protein
MDKVQTPSNSEDSWETSDRYIQTERTLFTCARREKARQVEISGLLLSVLRHPHAAPLLGPHFSVSLQRFAGLLLTKAYIDNFISLTPLPCSGPTSVFLFSALQDSSKRKHTWITPHTSSSKTRNALQFFWLVYWTTFSQLHSSTASSGKMTVEKTWPVSKC